MYRWTENLSKSIIYTSGKLSRKLFIFITKKEEEKDTFGFKNHRIKFLLNSYSSSNLQNSHKVEQLAQYVDKFQDFSKAWT